MAAYVTLYRAGQRLSVPSTLVGLYLDSGWSYQDGAPVDPDLADAGATGTTAVPPSPAIPTGGLGLSEDSVADRAEAGYEGVDLSVQLAGLSQSQLTDLYASGRITQDMYRDALIVRGTPPEAADALIGLMAYEAGLQLAPWQQVVYDSVFNVLSSSADAAGFADPKSFVAAWLDFHGDDMIAYAGGAGNPNVGLAGPQADMNDPRAISLMIQSAIAWANSRWQWGELSTSLRRRTGGGRAGAGGRSIRDQFDLEALSLSINAQYNALLLKDAPNAKALARAYVDQVVANPGKALDFNTWVRNRVLDDPTAKWVFANKPEGVSHEEYMAQKAQAIASVLGTPEDFGDRARGAAALNASPDALAGRLKLHAGVQRSENFLTSIENRYRSAARLLGAL